MDLDISDILADVSKPRSQSQHQSHYNSHDLQDSSYTDHQQLVRAWTSERNAPSLLPYPSALIDRIMTRVSTQISRIEDMSSGIDVSATSSSTIYTNNTTTTKPTSTNPRNTNLILSILQTDLSRTQFILRSYLRQRLSKITKYAVYHLKQQEKAALSTGTNTTATSSETEPKGNNILSPAESQFLRNHQALLSEFYDGSFLNSFPANLRRLDDSAGGVNMVEGPDGGVGVVVRCLRQRWGNDDEVSGLNATRGDDDGLTADVELRFQRGEVWVVRWRDVRTGVHRGDLELL